MANEDGNDDRLTKNEFAELIQHLSMQEILIIEYRIGTVWNKLVSRKNPQTPTLFCNLCVLETSSFKNLLAHIDGKKHKLQMERVKQLYHPDYTYPKNNKETNVQGEKLETLDDSKTNLNTETQTVKVQSKSDACSKISTEIEKQNDEDENKKEDEPISLCSSNESEERSLEKEDPKQDIKPKLNQEITNIRPVSEGTNKVAIRISEKRLPADINIDKNVDLKKRKIVVNPAAALSSKASSELKAQKSNRKPAYQTDLIIIPTVDRNKSNTGKASSTSTLQTQFNDPPKFSLKSYSSKPSENNVHGILGVEYVIKILKNRNDVSPRYECGLCELVLDGFAMQRHLEGYNHRLKFCEKHFPTAIRYYRQYMQNVPEPETFKVMAPVLAKLAQAIEQHHGRNLPHECFERDYSSNRHEILAKAFSYRHASEQYGPSFTHVVGSKEIDEFINNRHNYLPPQSSRTAIFDANAGGLNIKSNDRHQNSRKPDKEINFRDRYRHAGRENVLSEGNTYKSYMSSGLHEHMYFPSNNYTQQAEKINTVQPVDDKTYNLMVDDFLKGTLKGFSRKNASQDMRKRSHSPTRNSCFEKRKSLSPLRQNDIWQAYRHMVDQELYNLDERFKQYRKEPESHPSYNDEWQKFWKRRKDELVSAGVDHRNYNYQPEWVRFVKIRIEELYAQDVENLKIKSRERLCLPMSNEHISDEKYHVKSQNTSVSRESLATESNTSKNIGVSNSSQSNVPQVVSVLRLMTALEDSLGSLGPKITDLLSKALQTEKINPLYANAVILNDENCALIETAKEKLKGLVLTGLFEVSKTKVLNQVVNDAEALLNYGYQFKQQLASQRSFIASSVNPSQNNSSLLDHQSVNISSALSGPSNIFGKKTQPSTSSLTDNLLTRVDKKELASKLASSLVAQGKTDFDPQQLQQLIAVYKLFDKKKRENVGTVLSNRTTLQDSASTSKKTLSDTLSDLLKPSSYPIADISKTSLDATGSSNPTPPPRAQPYDVPRVAGNFRPSNSFASVLQNPRDNFFNNSARSMPNALSANSGGGNQLQPQNNYAMNYGNNLTPNQQNFTMSNVPSNQYPNNSRMAQNWGWNSNMGMNQNYNVDNSNKRLNQPPNWQNF